MSNQSNFVILPNGKLEMNINGLGDEIILEMSRFEGGDESFLWRFFEDYFTNGYYHLVPDQHKGLTEAPMLSDTWIDEETTEAQIEASNVWYFDNYQIESVQNTLLNNGKVIFDKV